MKTCCEHGKDTRDLCAECIATIPTIREREEVAYDKGFTAGAQATIALFVANLRAYAFDLRKRANMEQPFSREWLHMLSTATEAEEIATLAERGALSVPRRTEAA